MNLDEIKNLSHKAGEKLQKASNPTELKQVEVTYLGKKGQLTDLLKSLKDLSPDDKRTIGKAIQDAKNEFLATYTHRLQELETAEINQKLRSEFFDITLPNLDRKPSPEPGSIHPINTLQNEIETIFREMGFEIADGPEVESEYYNFEAINIPAYHPARDMQDTFFIENKQDPKHGNLVLRTHTSPVQARTLESKGTPVRIIVPGRVFRYEATDATHDSTFNQFEGLFIDKDISLCHLKGTIEEFLSRFFKRDIVTRLRPGYFPFVEPGLELDILWEKGKNGKADKWMEAAGAGMVHPNVLKAGGIDPDQNQGWAFGMGLTRLAMIRYKFSDIRQIHSNDLRFLKQF